MAMSDQGMMFGLQNPVWSEDEQALIVIAKTNSGDVTITIPADVVREIWPHTEPIDDVLAHNAYRALKGQIHAAAHKIWCVTGYGAHAITLTADNLTEVGDP